MLEERDPAWRESGRQFIASVSTLLERLLEYKSILKVHQLCLRPCLSSLPAQFAYSINRPFLPAQTEHHSPSHHMSCIAGLIQFYRPECDSGRRELFLRYVHRLYDLHVKAENHAEAAIAIRLHADLLRWSNRTLHADLRYPSQVSYIIENLKDFVLLLLLLLLLLFLLLLLLLLPLLLLLLLLLPLPFIPTFM